MTPKTEFFGRVEDYCLDLLDATEKLQFEQELAINEELREEVELHKNIQTAITELDVLDLRGKLEEIQVTDKSQSSFEMLDESTEIEQLRNELESHELINSFESLPKVHVYQHELTANENIHQYYKEQQSAEAVNEHDEDLNGFDMEGLEGLEEAILEADIMSLRGKLDQVAKSVEPQYSIEEIDDYINGEMTDDILAEFESELVKNDDLMQELKLHTDVEAAVNENDIMDLRSEMKNIMDSETSWNVSEQSIEDFIDGELDDALLEEFNAELKENTDLMAELALRENINEAIAETDVQALRAGLVEAREKSEKKEVRSIVLPKIEIGSTRFWRNSVAMIIVLVGLAGVLNNSMRSIDQTYNKHFEMPVWASERSLESSLDNIQIAQQFYQNADYQATISALNKIGDLEEGAFVAQFYKGLSNQNLQNYSDAIKEYQKVIDHANNMYIEEAEWYKALCYIKLNRSKEATRELIAVIDRKGHYEREAKAVLRRLKYTSK